MKCQYVTLNYSKLAINACIKHTNITTLTVSYNKALF